MVNQWIFEMDQRELLIFSGVIIVIMIAIYLVVNIHNI